MRTTYPVDLLVRDEQDDPCSVFEIVNFPNFYCEDAIELRRRMIERGLPAQLPYFLLLTQDRGFLWKDTKKDQLDVPPHYEFPMDGFVQRYEKDSSQHRLYTWDLKWLILQWLAHLSASSEPDTEEPKLTFVRSGLRDVIRDKFVELDEEI